MMKKVDIKKWLGLVLIVALVLRGVACLQMRELPAVQHPSQVTDMATYWRLSAEICQGNWPDHFDYQPFYYSVFLPFCRMFGGIWAVLVLQALLGSLCCLLIGLAAARLWGRRVGVLAALVLALSRMHVFYTPFALFEVLQSFWIAMLFACAVWAWRRNAWWKWLLMALILSCATLTRGNALLFLPGMLALCAWCNLRGKRTRIAWVKTLGLLLAMVLLFELPQMPFALRNYHYAGRWCGASTAGEKVLALGNTPEAPPGGLEYPLTYSRWVEQAERRPEEGRVSMSSNILHWALREPVIFAELKWRAALLFWDKQEIANNVSLEREGSVCSWLKLLPPFAVTGSLAFMGLLLLCRKLFKAMRLAKNVDLPDEALPLSLYFLYMLLCSWFATALFYNLARFRITTLPLMAVTSAFALDYLIEKLGNWRKINKDARLSLVLLVVVSVFFVCGLFGFWQENVEPWFYRQFRPNGLQCSFADTQLIYDHGPFTVGGFTFLEVPAGGICIEKKLCIPMGARQVKLRLPVVAKGMFSAQLLYDGKCYQLNTDNLVEQRFLTWLEVELPEITSDTFVFQLPQGMYFGVDNLRRYGRTNFIFADGKKVLCQGEAAVEAQY